MNFKANFEITNESKKEEIAACEKKVGLGCQKD